MHVSDTHKEKGTRTINSLVIEDDEAIRESLKLLLEFEGYTVYTASNGKEGLEILKEIPRPCIIFLDLMMPVMNGWDFIETIEKDVVLAKIPVVIVSAFADSGKSLHVKGIVKKPIDINVLMKIANQYCLEG
ncbi:MAG: response regulator [Bacteriovoracia bacterium]